MNTDCSPRRPSRPVPRQGYTLIEMLVVISLLGVLLTTTGGMLHLLMKVESACRHEQARQRTLSQLEEVFRRDVRWSLTARCSDAENELMLTGPAGSSIRYRIDDSRVERSEHGPGDATTHRERFLLPECVIRLESASTDWGVTWSLLVRHPTIRLTQTSELRGSGMELPIRATSNVSRQSIAPP
ncbi:MAG: type II secretion system protein [Planctomycetaceae bacterium]|nr:type II secretion system protein [Planctomycetaceae bacterium]